MADLPRGTVTFLFTDVEGSTALWERDRTAMRTAVERHLALLRGAVAAHGGVAFKTVGDAVQAAFPTAPDALAAAVEAQRALQGESWPPPIESLRVRMALHAGEATPDPHGDYLAAPLNRLARLLAAGHGSQVLITEVVERLVAGALPEGVSLRPLGSHRLRDLHEPEEVFQAVVPGLPDRFPLLLSLPQHPTNLAIPPTALIGREAETAAILRLLDEGARLVTLTGPGGTGKSRLAQEVGAVALARYPDGVFFVDLSTLTDPAIVVPTIAAALGVREIPGQPLLLTLASHLAPKRLLLLLDNYEQVLDAAPDAARLLAAGPGLVIVVTSREPLHVRGERAFPVPPLSLPAADHLPPLDELSGVAAVALFVERASAAQPEFSLKPDNAAAVAAICRHLDGLPLAIELAAARVKVLPPAALLPRLVRSLPLLTGGGRDLPARQRTMRDAIAWSYDLLGAQERIFFHRLGVFVGGWTLEAAEAVAGAGGDPGIDVLDGVASLADQSLIRLDESDVEPRFRMLEPIREFAQERLAASGDEATLQQAHAAYFLGLAEQAKPHLYRARQHEWLRKLEADHPNFRAALDALAASDDHEAHLRLAANLGSFWWLHAHLAEGRAHLERALARATAPTPQRAEALLGIGRIVTSQGDLAAGEAWLRKSEALARSLDVPKLRWQALFNWGQAAEYGGDDARAIPLHESALAVARELDDPQAASVPLWALSEVAYRRGDLETAARLSEEAIALLHPAGDELILSLGLTTIGAVALVRGDTPRATAAYRQALGLALGIKMVWAVAGALAGFAAVAAARGDHLAAARLLGAAETFREASHQHRMANFYQHAQTTQAVRAALGEAALAAAWDAGRALPAEEAVELPSSLGLLEGSAG